MPPRVEFDEDTFGRPTPQAQAAKSAGPNSKMVEWLMKKGIVKSPAVGQVVLLIVVVLNLIVTYVVLKYFV